MNFDIEPFSKRWYAIKSLVMLDRHENKNTYSNYATLVVFDALRSAGRSLSSIYFLLHCHSTKTGRKCQRSNSGHRTSRKTRSVSLWHCQSMKSLSRLTPLVLINKSKGGLSWVYRFWVIVYDVMVSGSGYTGFSCASEPSLCVDSGCRVVPEDMDSSASEIDGAGDVSRNVGRSEAFRFWERIF